MTAIGRLAGGLRLTSPTSIRELHLLEALRTLRLIHYSYWLAQRWEDRRFRSPFRGLTRNAIGGIEILELRNRWRRWKKEPLRVKRAIPTNFMRPHLTLRRGPQETNEYPPPRLQTSPPSTPPPSVHARSFMAINSRTISSAVLSHGGNSTSDKSFGVSALIAPADQVRGHGEPLHRMLELTPMIQAVPSSSASTKATGADWRFHVAVLLHHQGAPCPIRSARAFDHSLDDA